MEYLVAYLLWLLSQERASYMSFQTSIPAWKNISHSSLRAAFAEVSLMPYTVSSPTKACCCRFDFSAGFIARSFIEFMALFRVGFSFRSGKFITRHPHLFSFLGAWEDLFFLSFLICNFFWFSQPKKRKKFFLLKLFSLICIFRGVKSKVFLWKRKIIFQTDVVLGLV